MADFMQYLVSGLSQGSIYALVGLGFTVIFMVTSIINFAQGEFVMLGGMLSYVLFASLGLPVPGAVLLALVLTIVVGLLLYRLGIRPARNASVVSLIIITIGASVFIRGIAGEIWGKDPVRPSYFSGEQPLSFLGAYIHPQALWIFAVTIIVMVAFHLFFNRTMMGKALRACASSQLGAGLVGIDARVMALLAFGLAASLGAIGGVVMAPLTTTAYGVGAMMGLKGFVAAALVGFRSQLGTVAAGLMLGVVESLAIALNWGPFSSAYKDAISLVVLIAILLFRSSRLAAEERAS